MSALPYSPRAYNLNCTLKVPNRETIYFGVLGMRLCEQELGVAGKSPYDFRPIGQPYAGFVCGSVKLFYSLYRTRDFHLHGVQKAQKSKVNLIDKSIW